jgi:hypothetical protein
MESANDSGEVHGTPTLFIDGVVHRGPYDAAVLLEPLSLGGSPMSHTCQHLDLIRDVEPSGAGCVECLAAGRGDWVHLRMCQECGHIGCCDNSPGKHATAHYRTVGDPIIRSFEPGEDWYYCYPDDLMFEIEGAPPAPSHP